MSTDTCTVEGQLNAERACVAAPTSHEGSGHTQPRGAEAPFLLARTLSENLEDFLGKLGYGFVEHLKMQSFRVMSVP